MYSVVRLRKNDLPDFLELNNMRENFNSQNKDFFTEYNKCNFIQQMFLRNQVKIIKNMNQAIGYIWYEYLEENKCCILSLNIRRDHINTECLKLLLNTIRKSDIVDYKCEGNGFNFELLENTGFQKRSGTLQLKLVLDANMESAILDTDIEVFTKNKHEETRCFIQNEVFNEDDRIPITVDDIFLDEVQDYYFDEGAIFIKVDDKHIGYGQLIIDTNTASIVNVGILEEYRGKGYGRRLLMYLLQLAKIRGFNQVNIKVAFDNYIALNLYKSLGFTLQKECYLFEYKKAGK